MLLCSMRWYFPRMMQRQVSEVTYNQFIADLDAGKVSAVEENESKGPSPT